jgi:hypothetical protein
MKYPLQVFGASSRPSDCHQRHWKPSRKVIRRHRRTLLNHFLNRSHFRRQYLSPRIEVASTGPILSKFRFFRVRAGPTSRRCSTRPFLALHHGGDGNIDGMDAAAWHDEDRSRHRRGHGGSSPNGVPAPENCLGRWRTGTPSDPLNGRTDLVRPSGTEHIFAGTVAGR